MTTKVPANRAAHTENPYAYGSAAVSIYLDNTDPKPRVTPIKVSTCSKGAHAYIRKRYLLHLQRKLKYCRIVSDFQILPVRSNSVQEVSN